VAWEQVYARWNRLTQLMLKGAEEVKASSDHANLIKKTIKPSKSTKPSSAPSPAVPTIPLEVPSECISQLADIIHLQTQNEWTHYSGFLCAAAGVCLTQEKVIGMLQ
jgi:hypothetical protein